jgi:hypothetical protein
VEVEENDSHNVSRNTQHVRLGMLVSRNPIGFWSCFPATALQRRELGPSGRVELSLAANMIIEEV